VSEARSSETPRTTSGAGAAVPSYPPLTGGVGVGTRAEAPEGGDGAAIDAMDTAVAIRY